VNLRIIIFLAPLQFSRFFSQSCEKDWSQFEKARFSHCLQHEGSGGFRPGNMEGGECGENIKLANKKLRKISTIQITGRLFVSLKY
jgi:hypothetical protein